MALPLNSYEPKFLVTQELLYSHWPSIAPLLERAPIIGPYSTDDVLKLAVAGAMHIFVFSADTVDGPDVKLVMVLSPSNHPNLPVMNIVTIAGSNLRHFAGRFWETLKGWCYMNGARVIDAYIPDKLLPTALKLGFVKESTHVRAPIDPQ